jgi:TRAP-type C4-dicarboxylate transport system substrate-binding protein
MKKLLFVFLIASLIISVNSAAFAAPKYRFKMGHPNPANTPYDGTAKKFAKLAGEKTDGRVQVTVFPNNQLGDWTETFELIMRGDVEMGFQCANASYDPKLNFAYYMPYVVRNMEEAKKAYGDGGWALSICKELWEEHGIKALAAYPAGVAGLSLRDMPPAPGDPNVEKKMKIRVMPLKACELTYKRLGYIPTPIPYAETYSAIQTGIADGQMGGGSFQAWSFRDVNKVWVRYNDYFENHFIVINMKIWDSLPEDIQKGLQEAANEASAIRWAQVETEDAHYIKVLQEENGWTIVNLSDEELDACANAIRKDVWPELEEMLGEDLFNKAMNGVGLSAR